MTVERGVIRRVDWRSVCPWLVIFRTFRIATSLPVLFLATLATILVPVGWRVAEFVCVDEESRIQSGEYRELLEVNRAWPGAEDVVPAPNGGRTPQSVRDIVFSSTNLLETVYFRLSAPVKVMFSGRLALSQWGYFGMGLLWTLVVWAFFGGAITRIAAMKLGREEQIGMGEAVRFATRRIASYFAAPLFPLLGVALIAIPIVLMGLLMRLDVGVAIAGFAWILVLVGGLIITILLLGLAFGWPLMWGAISCEETGDAFEAFSRSYSYTFQRPLHYLFYAFVATTFGEFSWLLVYHFSEAVLGLTDWAAALGAGERWRELDLARYRTAESDAVNTGMFMLQLWGGLVRSIATAFGYSFFWCVAIAVYLLLRRGVDETEFDEVFAENEDHTYELPPLSTDDAGVDTQPAAESEDNSPANGNSGPPPLESPTKDKADDSPDE